MSDWSSDVCSSDLRADGIRGAQGGGPVRLDGPRTAGADESGDRAVRTDDAMGTPRAGAAGDRRGGVCAAAAAPCIPPALRRAGTARAAGRAPGPRRQIGRPTSELQSLMRISYAVFCLKKKNTNIQST